MILPLGALGTSLCSGVRFFLTRYYWFPLNVLMASGICPIPLSGISRSFHEWFLAKKNNSSQKSRERLTPLDSAGPSVRHDTSTTRAISIPSLQVRFARPRSFRSRVICLANTRWDHKMEPGSRKWALIGPHFVLSLLLGFPSLSLFPPSLKYHHYDFWSFKMPVSFGLPQGDCHKLQINDKNLVAHAIWHDFFC